MKIYLFGSLSYTVAFKFLDINFTIISFLLIFLFIDYSYGFNEERPISIFYIFKKELLIYVSLFNVFLCIAFS